ncbi:MAG: hypothetical protein J5741_06645 [Bacteroidales bacterium]|nr:hypothetical protein [Bacteroidales bacterium]
MKKLFGVLIAITLCFSVAAQDHLTFMGVPIDGTMKNFSQRMTEKGLFFVLEEGGVHLFMGDFMGYKNCVVGVVPLQKQDLVYSVLACVVEAEDWPSLQKIYDDIVKKMKMEYGEPDESEETFLIPVKNDAEKLNAVLNGKCNYMKSFTVKNGEIDVVIENFEDVPCVIVQYTDFENALKESE